LKIQIPSRAEDFFDASGPPQRFQVIQLLIEGEKHLRPGMTHQELQFLLPEEARKGHWYGRSLQTPEIEGKPISGIRSTNPDVVPWFHIHADESRCNTVGFLVELRIADLRRPFAHSKTIREKESGTFKIACEIHGLAPIFLMERA
jgi:hypothetical protein